MNHQISPAVGRDMNNLITGLDRQTSSVRNEIRRRIVVPDEINEPGSFRMPSANTPTVSRKILGRMLVDNDRRDAVVLATKAVSRPSSPRRFDASRGHLLDSLDGSLRRLGVDHIDLWQLHAWDSQTPIEEGAVSRRPGRDVRQGALRRDQQLLGLAEDRAGRRVAECGARQVEFPISTQVEYSLLQRGVEREVVPAVRAHGMGLIAWSALGAGSCRASTAPGSRRIRGRAISCSPVSCSRT